MLPSGIPLTESRGGVAFPEYLVLPPTCKVAAYVRSGGPADGDSTYIANNTVTTLAAGLDRVRSGLGDTVVVRRGHSESVVDATMFDYVEAGTTIIGEGDPWQSNAPTFRWTTAATANWTVDQADITIANLRLKMEGYNGVTAGITVTAAGARIIGNYILLASATDYHCVTGIKVAGAGHYCTIQNNYIFGSGEDITQAILVDDLTAVIPTNARIMDNVIQVSGATGTSCVTIACATTGLGIARNKMYNTKAASTATVAIEDTASDGLIYDNYSAVNNSGGTTTAQGIVFAGTTTTTIKCFNNYTTDVVSAQGILAPAATT